MFTLPSTRVRLVSAVLAVGVLLVVGLFTWSQLQAQTAPFVSSELGMATYSPNGEAGGALMPASGSSDPCACTGEDCTPGICAPDDDSYACTVAVSPNSAGVGSVFTIDVTDPASAGIPLLGIPPSPPTVNSVRVCANEVTTTSFLGLFTNTSYTGCTNVSNQANQEFDSSGLAVQEYYVVAETRRSGNSAECVGTFAVTAATTTTTPTTAPQCDSAGGCSIGNYTYQGVTTNGDQQTTTYTCSNSAGTSSCSYTETIVIPQPDLVPNAPSVNPGTVEPGETVNFNSVVNNTGTAVAGPYDMVFHIDTNNDGVSEYQRNLREAASTNPGATGSESYSQNIPASAPLGTWRVGYFVDTGDEVDESNEANNWSGWTNFTVVAGTIPDCSDGVDNDGDGLIDYPTDPACDDEDDDEEDPPQCNDPSADNYLATGSCTYPPECSDGVDNDGDGLIDYPADPGCDDADDDDERNALVADPTIEAVPNVIRQGEEFDLVWDPKGNINCELSDNVVDGSGNKPDATVADSITLSASRPAEFSIICDYGQEASTRIKVIPNFFET